MSHIIVGNPEPVLFDESKIDQDSERKHPADVRLQNRCLKVLWSHYPGATWRVDVDSRKGVVDIFCMNFSTRWGVRWKLGRIYTDPDLYWVKMAGGEIMERARVARGKFDEDTAEIGWVEGIRPQDQPIRGMAI